MVTPDGSKKNSGPQAEIPIRDGVFDTTFKSGEGFAGGPARVQVTGLTEKGGALCDYEFFVDLPKADSTHTFDVPKEGKAKPSGDI